MSLTQVTATQVVDKSPVVDLLDAPLPQLLTAYGVQLVDSTITDPTFIGAFVEHRDGQRILAMPTGRSAFERDTAARLLLAQGLGWGVAPAPAPLEVTRA